MGRSPPSPVRSPGPLVLDAHAPRADGRSKMTCNPLLSTLLAFLWSSLFSFAAEAVEGIWEKSDDQARIRSEDREGSPQRLSHPGGGADAPVHDTEIPTLRLRKPQDLGPPDHQRIPEGGHDKWVGGTLYDCRRGKTYKGSIWLAGRDAMRMRDYLGVSLLGATSEWKRVP